MNPVQTLKEPMDKLLPPRQGVQLAWGPVKPSTPIDFFEMICQLPRRDYPCAYPPRNFPRGQRGRHLPTDAVVEDGLVEGLYEMADIFERDAIWNFPWLLPRGLGDEQKLQRIVESLRHCPCITELLMWRLCPISRDPLELSSIRKDVHFSKGNPTLVSEILDNDEGKARNKPPFVQDVLALLESLPASLREKLRATMRRYIDRKRILPYETAVHFLGEFEMETQILRQELEESILEGVVCEDGMSPRWGRRNVISTSEGLEKLGIDSRHLEALGEQLDREPTYASFIGSDTAMILQGFVTKEQYEEGPLSRDPPVWKGKKYGFAERVPSQDIEYVLGVAKDCLIEPTELYSAMQTRAYPDEPVEFLKHHLSTHRIHNVRSTHKLAAFNALVDNIFAVNHWSPDGQNPALRTVRLMGKKKSFSERGLNNVPVDSFVVLVAEG